MQTPFTPLDPADLRRQASLYRRLSGIVRDAWQGDKLRALAARCEEMADEATDRAVPAT